MNPGLCTRRSKDLFPHILIPRRRFSITVFLGSTSISLKNIQIRTFTFLELWLEITWHEEGGEEEEMSNSKCLLGSRSYAKCSVYIFTKSHSSKVTSLFKKRPWPSLKSSRNPTMHSLSAVLIIFIAPSTTIFCLNVSTCLCTKTEVIQFVMFTAVSLTSRKMSLAPSRHHEQSQLIHTGAREVLMTQGTGAEEG